MLFSMYYLKDCKKKIENIATSCHGNIDINIIKTKVATPLNEIIFALEELGFTTDSYDYMRRKQSAIDLRQSIIKAKNIDDIKSLLDDLLNTVYADINYDNISSYDFKLSFKRYCNTFNKLDNETIENITRLIQMPNRNVNILDARCNYGEDIQNLASHYDNVTTYGIEADQYTAKTACERLDKVAVGGVNGSRITNNAFDILMVQPIVSWETIYMGQQNPYSLKKEKVFLNSVIKYLRTDGIMILTIPYFRLYKDICLLLAKNFYDIQIMRTVQGFSSYGSIIIMCKKKADNKNIDNDVYRQLRQYHDQKNILAFNEQFKHYTLPNTELPIEIFRGSILDSAQLLKMVNSSGCMNEFWKNQHVEKLYESTKQPLLPFNIGQIGLVLTSGCLDGVIDEGNGNYHLIKGKVSKQSSIEQNYDDNSQLETQETISNRVEINVILPNGEFKVLA